MSGRYYLTGVQLGILMSSLDEKVRMEILNKIMNDQFLGNVGEETKQFFLDDLKEKEKKA